MINRRQALAHLGALAALPASAALSTPTAGTGTMVRWLTNLGPIDLQLYDSAAPLTVANFLGYVNRGAYLNSFFHRSVPNFVIQGGGFTWGDQATGYSTIPTVAPVPNEFHVSRSNLRGTIAMAKQSGKPDSATDQWFVNLVDNSATLDAGRSASANGGFTVFGRVTASGLVMCDQIAALKVVKTFASPMGELPMIGYTGGSVTAAHLVRALSVTVLTGPTDSDRIFNYLEGVYPQYVPVAGLLAGTSLGYYFRYYPGTNSYLGTKDGNVHYLVPSISPDVQPLGSMAVWLAAAAAEGY